MMASNTCCYYTPEELAVCLLNLIPERKITSCIDICCGHGALLRAAHSVFSVSELVGVDIEYDDFYQSISQCTFRQMDGFQYVRKRQSKKFDLILSNPPFGRTDEVYYCGTMSGLTKKRFECQMMNANLSLMHSQSWMLIILPSTFIVGSSFLKARREIASAYKVHSVVRLPDDTFGSHLIKTYAVILNGSVDDTLTKTYMARHKRQEWELGEENEMAYDGVKAGIWYGKEISVNPIDVEVFRGTISSSEFTDAGLPVYHCAQYGKKKWKPSIRYVDGGFGERKRAKRGDVIIDRVGHSCGYWNICDEEDILVSDCIIVIRRKRGIIKCLNKISLDGRLDIQPRGVATKFITKEDIINRITSVWGKD